MRNIYRKLRLARISGAGADALLEKWAESCDQYRAEIADHIALEGKAHEALSKAEAAGTPEAFTGPYLPGYYIEEPPLPPTPQQAEKSPRFANESTEKTCEIDAGGAQPQGSAVEASAPVAEAPASTSPASSEKPASSGRSARKGHRCPAPSRKTRGKKSASAAIPSSAASPGRADVPSAPGPAGVPPAVAAGPDGAKETHVPGALPATATARTGGRDARHPRADGTSALPGA